MASKAVGEGQFPALPAQPFSAYTPEELAAQVAKPGPTFDFDITDDGKAKVYVKGKDGSWLEAKPGTFRLATAATNAVLFSISGNLDTSTDAGWVETQNFTITHKE